MNTLNICPCCSNSLMHHFGNHREYWFCRHCWSEMPNLKSFRVKKNQESAKALDLSTNFSQFRKPALVRL